jgi:dUTP pyrophosphatase
VNVEIQILDPRLEEEFGMPARATLGAAALDIRAMPQKPMGIIPGARELIPTGIAINIKTATCAGILLPRSGLSHAHGIILGNSVGLLDPDYQGEILLSCWNTGDDWFCLEPGMRIAQLLFINFEKVNFVKVDAFEKTDRAENGFGSTGIE